MKKWTIQLDVHLMVSREVQAETIEEALAIAQKDAAEEKAVKPARGWATEHISESKVTGVFG